MPRVQSPRNVISISTIALVSTLILILLLVVFLQRERYEYR